MSFTAARLCSARLRLRHRALLTGPVLLCVPHWEIQQLMNVELVSSVSSDYLDLNLFSNKHSASRLAPHKPPFAASPLHRLLIALFSSSR